MKQTVAAILIFTLIFPASLFADENNTDSLVLTDVTLIPPSIMGIHKGESAPFSGVLLNTTAAAQLFTEKDYTYEQCKLRIDFAVQKEIAKYNLLLKSTQTSLVSLQQKYDTITALKDKEIDRLSKIAIEKDDDYSKWWAVGGFVVGVTLTVGLFYITSQVVK